MGDRVSYPVIVEYTQRHIIWVEADTHEGAVDQARYDTWDKTDDQETLFEAGCSVQAPKDAWDWQEVYSDHYYEPYSTEANAHVEAHEAELRRRKLAAEKAACAAAGHPDTEPPLSDGRVWCKGCTQYLPSLAEVTPC
jgi:hypothetical protein